MPQMLYGAQQVQNQLSHLALQPQPAPQSSQAAAQWQQPCSIYPQYLPVANQNYQQAYMNGPVSQAPQVAQAPQAAQSNPAQ